MKKFKKFLLAGLCGLVLASAGGLAACDNGEPEINVIGGDYSYINPVRERAEIDEGFKIDGVLDEAEYATVKSVSMKKRLGYETADVDVTVYFGEKGLYFGFVDTENTRIYANEERSTTTGSAIEMYLMIGGTGVSEGDLYHTFEIDLTAGGRLALKRNACFANSQGNWRSCDRPDEIQPYMAVTAQGGEINTPECTGYTVEFYMPYAYFVDLGIMREAVKPEFIYMNPAHIKSNSARASDGVRTWTPLTETQLSSYNYSRPSSWYKFDENGIVTNDINVTYKGEGSGIVSEKNGFDNMPNGNSLTLNIIENADSVIKSFRVNGVECIKEIVSDGTKGIYTLSKVNGAINIEAEFEKLSDVTYQLSGVVSYTGEAAEWDDVAYNVALYANRSIKDTEIDFDKITGEYALDLAEGEYRIVLRT
ncbi:MAG: hypothetical protein J6Y43_06825, partial [Clostridia bacterium]|nr:hypothetical protein [Clostridia bacterium]